MSEDIDNFVENCFLRPLVDPRIKNDAAKTAPPPPTVKTELQVVFLTDESQKMTMETLRSIHGDEFQLEDPSKYKDRGARLKGRYWQDRGTLMVQSITNYAQSADSDLESPEDRLRRYALHKLENYGFALTHCVEAYDHCKGDTEEALKLLFCKYMHVPDETETNESSDNTSYTEQDLIDMRTDEKAALESIYDTAFEEKEYNKIWSLKFKLDHLLIHSPSEVRKKCEARQAAAKEAAAELAKAKKERLRCRNFDLNGTCKFGNKCRFLHLRENQEKDKKAKAVFDDIENEKWFFLEVRFPSGTRYPYEAPHIYIKSTCLDIPNDIFLRIAKHLYSEAVKICSDGFACVYTLCEMLLQNDEDEERSISKIIAKDTTAFPNPNKSLFYVEADNEALNNNLESIILATHYERGQTSRSIDGFKGTKEEIEREDRNLVSRFLQNQDNERYRKMISIRQKLPAFQKMMDILSAIDSSQVVVISGETGCGKSTQVPQFILDNWLFQSSQLEPNEKLQHVEIICTQPRRLSAIGVAERVAEERTERTGKTVGYQIRLENKISKSTRLVFCTTGILLRRLTSDPMLESVSHIIVDEVHERSEESDFLLAILKSLLPKRPKLKVILMSATLNAKLFSEYFGENVPIFEIPGRTHPVEQLFLEDILEVCDYVMECDSAFSRKVSKKEEEELLRELEYADIKAENVAPPKKIKDENLNLASIYARFESYSKKTCKSIYLMEPMKINPELIESVLKYIVEGEHEWPRDGTILIFLPGFQEIAAVHESLNNSSLFSSRSSDYLLIPLHSSLSNEEQAAIFNPAPNGKRKIVLSTNIAETSITIDDCVFVIDCGLMKEKRFDSNRNMESLELVWISRANAKQRQGRAGRVKPGVSIHLYTKHRFLNHFLAQPVPEIHRVPLEQLLLRIKTLPFFEYKNVIEVLGQTLEPPTEENIISAVERLQAVGALDEEQNLTPLGHHLSALPVDVRIGKLMLFGAIFQCLDSVLTIAACLSNKSPFLSPFNKREEAERRKRTFAIQNSDHLTNLIAYKKWLEIKKRSFFGGRNFANENFLSMNTLQTISEVKYQFLELLVSIGFVPVNVPRKRKNVDDNILELTGHDLNVNGENNRLLISLLCAALYPNIVKVLTPELSYIQTASGSMAKPANAKDLRFQTRSDGYVAVHPSSVNSNIANFLSPFLVYQEKVKTSRIFIRDCSMLPLTSLVLFAGSDLKIELHKGEFLFLLEDGWLVLKAHNHETAAMIQCLREELLKILAEKIRDPCLNLLNHKNGCKIIQNIVYLITNNK